MGTVFAGGLTTMVAAVLEVGRAEEMTGALWHSRVEHNAVRSGGGQRLKQRNTN